MKYISRLFLSTIALLILISYPLDVPATVQGPEILIYGGKTYEFYNTCPLSSFYKRNKDRPNFEKMDTAHWRGYTGTWEIADGMFYMTHIDAWIKEETGLAQANLEKLFGSRCIDGRVAATWFTGELILPEGEIIERRFMHSSLHERDIILRIESGKVVGEEIVDNTKTADQRAINAELFQAMEKGAAPEVRTLLENGADPNASHDLFGYTALMKAASMGSREIVDLLLENGADARANNGVDTALTMVEGEGEAHLDIVKRLVENGAEVNAAEGSCTSPLSYEAVYGNTPAVTYLLESGANVDWRDCNGGTALMDACRRGHTEVVSLLLRRHPDVNAVDDDGSTALTLAANTQIVQMLKKAGGNGELDNTALLIIAVQEGNLADAKTSLELGADPNAVIPGSYGDNLLTRAAFDGDTEMVRLLLEQGADPNAGETEIYSMTPLMKATVKGHTEVMALLLDRGADINTAFGMMETALMLAIDRDQTDAVRLLLERGAGATEKTGMAVFNPLEKASSDGRTEMVEILLAGSPKIDPDDLAKSLKLAVFKGHEEIVKMFLEKGADPTARYGGRTLIESAQENGFPLIAQMLKKAGAEE